jgi:hypothetical protein
LRPGALLRGDTANPIWERPALLALLGATAILYLWNLAASGWANAYYPSPIARRRTPETATSAT